MYDVPESFVTNDFVLSSLSKLTKAWLAFSFPLSLCFLLSFSSFFFCFLFCHGPLPPAPPLFDQQSPITCPGLLQFVHCTLNLSCENSQIVRLIMLMLQTPDSIWFHAHLWFSARFWLMCKPEVGLRRCSSKMAALRFRESMQTGHCQCHGSWALDLNVTLTFSQCVLQGPLHQHTLMWWGTWW